MCADNVLRTAASAAGQQRTQAAAAGAAEDPVRDGDYHRDSYQASFVLGSARLMTSL